MINNPTAGDGYFGVQQRQLPIIESLREGLKRGLAVANTDLGTAPDISQLQDHPARCNDFGHRATHEMTRVAKFLVGAYQAPAARYLN